MYLDAERAAFKGPYNPGLDVSSTGRGCNTIAGEFYIYEFVEGQKLAFDFIQYCDSTSVKLKGSVRINSSVPVPYTEPLAVATSTERDALEDTSIQTQATHSIAGDLPLVSYHWQQLSGATVQIQNPDAEVTTVQLPAGLDLGGTTIVLGLTVADSAGRSDDTQVKIHVRSKSDPTSYFRLQSEAGDYVGGGLNWEYSVNNSRISMIRSADNGVSVRVNGSEYWSADFSAPDGVQLEEGDYSPAIRFPFQGAGVAGMAVFGDGRGCNQLYGSFNVNQLRWESRSPMAFYATFEQHCEQPSAPALRGEVAVNAVHPNVPTSDAGGNITVGEGQIVNLDGSGSYDAFGSIAEYRWSIADSNIAINNQSQSRANFMAPALADREAARDLVVTLLILDDEGFMAKDEVVVRVKSTNIAPIAGDDSIVWTTGERYLVKPLRNDTDADGSVLSDSIIIAQGPAAGNVIVHADGTLEYLPHVDEPMTDTILYAVRDNDGAISNVASIALKIAAPGSDKGGSGSGGVLDWSSLVLLLTGTIGLRNRRQRKR